MKRGMIGVRVRGRKQQRRAISTLFASASGKIGEQREHLQPSS